MKPNFVLALLLVLATIHKDWRERLALLFAGLVLVKFYRGFEIDSLILGGSTLAGFALVDYLPWLSFINLFGAVFLSTFVSNVYGFSFQGFALELAYNIVIAVAFWLILHKSNVWNKKNKRN